MNSLFNRIVGVILILIAIIGMLFSVVGIAAVWTFKPRVTDSVLANLDVFSNALDTTSQGLVVADQSLVTSIASVTALKDTVAATAKTINQTTPLVDTMAKLTKEDLPSTVRTTQTSLAAAQESAKIIDSVLKAITSIPFVSKDVYNPPVPLHVALQQVSDSLKGLPDALKTMDKSLSDTRNNLVVIQADTQVMADDIDGIQNSLEDAQGVVKQYRQLVSELHVEVNRMKTRAVTWINTLAILFTLILIWVGIAQLGLLLQGWELVHRPPITVIEERQ